MDGSGEEKVIDLDTLQYFWHLLNSTLEFADEDKVPGLKAAQEIIELVVTNHTA